jgi:hypothetical protein
MEHDRCLLCGRKLKNKEARIRGLGSKCWQKLKRLDKQEKAKRKERIEAKKLKVQLIKGQVDVFEMIGDEKTE